VDGTAPSAPPAAKPAKEKKEKPVKEKKDKPAQQPAADGARRECKRLNRVVW
jgi:hypothetical protein